MRMLVFAAVQRFFKATTAFNKYIEALKKVRNCVSDGGRPCSGVCPKIWRTSLPAPAIYFVTLKTTPDHTSFHGHSLPTVRFSSYVCLFCNCKINLFEISTLFLYFDFPFPFQELGKLSNFLASSYDAILSFDELQVSQRRYRVKTNEEIIADSSSLSGGGGAASKPLNFAIHPMELVAQQRQFTVREIF